MSNKRVHVIEGLHQREREANKRNHIEANFDPVKITCAWIKEEKKYLTHEMKNIIEIFVHSAVKSILLNLIGMFMNKFLRQL